MEAHNIDADGHARRRVGAGLDARVESSGRITAAQNNGLECSPRKLRTTTPRRSPDRMLLVLKPDPQPRAGRRISINPTRTSPTLRTKRRVTHQSQVGASGAPDSAGVGAILANHGVISNPMHRIGRDVSTEGAEIEPVDGARARCEQCQYHFRARPLTPLAG